MLLLVFAFYCNKMAFPGGLPNMNGQRMNPAMNHAMMMNAMMMNPMAMSMYSPMNPMPMYSPFGQHPGGLPFGFGMQQMADDENASVASAGASVGLREDVTQDRDVTHMPGSPSAALGRPPTPDRNAHDLSDEEEGSMTEGEFLSARPFGFDNLLSGFPNTASQTNVLIPDDLSFSESDAAANDQYADVEDAKPEDADLLADLRKELSEVPEGASLRDDVTQVVNQLWIKERSVPEAKAIFDKYPRPAGLGSHKVFMNPKLHLRIPKFSQTRDLRLRSAQGAVAAAAVPVATLINTLQNHKQRKEVMDPAVMCPMLTDTVAMLGMASLHINRMRRELIKPNVNSKFRGLCDKAYPESKLLLGDDLYTDMKEAGTEEQLMRDFTATSFKPAGKAANKSAPKARSHPYPRHGKGGNGNSKGEFLLNVDKPLDMSMALWSSPSNRFLNAQNLSVSEVLGGMCSPNLPGSSSSSSVSGQQPPCEQGQCQGQRSRQGQDYDQERLDPTIPAEVSAPSAIDLNKWGSEFEAGRISLCVDEWAKITSDPTILSYVRGIKLEFDGDPPKQTWPMPEMKFSEQELNFVRQEIANLLEKKVIVKAAHCEGEFISNIFLVEKKEPGKYRMILNLKHLNKFTKKLHFKMETLLTTLALITPGAYLMSFDFQDAYYSCSIFEPHRKYLRFMLDGQLYEFCALPNGLSSGPRIFTKLVKVALTHLRLEHDVTISAYLDDSLLVEYLSLAIAMIKGSKSAELLQKLGFTINIPKSVAYPVTAAEHLGFWIDSVQMLVSLTPKKVDKIIKFIDRCLNAERLTIRDLASVKGKIEATRPANLYALLMCKNLEIAKIAALKASNFNYDRKMALSAECRKDLLWAKEALPSTSAPIRPPPPDYTISTDSSKRGWGINDYQTMQRGGGRWSFEEALHHINELELKAAYFGLRGFCADMHGIHLRIMVDNTSALAAINKQGSTRSLGLNVLARELWDYARERRIWVSAAHIPGRLNVEADTASREFDENTEWSLRADIFGSICDKFGKPTIDLFASRLNCKVLRYCAWQPDPSAVFINALMMSSWEGEFFYAFPPFSIIHSVIQKCIQDRAKGILVVPDWPSQPWYTVLNSISLGDRFRFTVIDDELFLPFSSDSLCHPLAPLRMMATKVNGALISSTGGGYSSRDYQKQ